MHQFIEAIFILSMLINAALFIPQSIKAYRTNTAGMLSLSTFGGFNLIQVAVMLHAYIHHDWYLVLGMSLSVITCGSITIQIIRAWLKK